MITLLVIWSAISILFILSLCAVAKRSQHQAITGDDRQTASMVHAGMAGHSGTQEHVELATQTAFSA